MCSENKGADQLRSYCEADLIAKLICAFVFAYADCWFSHAAADLIFRSVSRASPCRKVAAYAYITDLLCIVVKIVISDSDFT